MRIHIETTCEDKIGEPVVGNVYPMRGGRSGKYGHVMILLAITEPIPERYDSIGRQALMLVVDTEGRPRGVTNYGIHYFEGKCPIAFVDGINDIDLTMRSL